MAQQGESTVHAVAVKLPPFATMEAIAWFRRAEVQFRQRKVTDPCTRADYVLEALPEAVFADVSAWLEQQQEEDIVYESLKSHLLQRYCLTNSSRAQKILAMPQQPLGDRTAVQLWNELQSLSKLPDSSDGKPRQIDLMREVFLLSLPSSIRAHLYDADDLPMDELVQKANNLIAAAKASGFHTIAGIEHTEDSDADVNAAYHRPQGRHQSAGGPAQRRGRLSTSGYFTYHARFGDAARNCLPGCRWSKNSKSGR